MHKEPVLVSTIRLLSLIIVFRHKKLCSILIIIFLHALPLHDGGYLNHFSVKTCRDNHRNNFSDLIDAYRALRNLNNINQLQGLGLAVKISNTLLILNSMELRIPIVMQ